MQGRLRFSLVSCQLRNASYVCSKCRDKLPGLLNFRRYVWTISTCPEDRELAYKPLLTCSNSNDIKSSIRSPSFWHPTQTGWEMKLPSENFRSSPTLAAEGVERDKGERNGDWMDLSTYAFLLRKCGYAKDALEGQRLHDYIINSGREQDCPLGNLLVQMYGKCENFENAHDVFVHMYERNVFSWTIMIQVLLENGLVNKGLQFFQQMEQEGVIPNHVSFINIVSACDCEETLAEGKRIHARIIARTFESDVVISSALINMYSKCGCVDSSRSVFEKMPQRDVLSWNALIAAYSRFGEHREVLQLYQRMQSESILPTNITFVTVLAGYDGLSTLAEENQMNVCISGYCIVLDVVTGTVLLKMYAKRGNLEGARKLFSIMPERNVVSWTTMIAAYVQVGQAKEVFRLFRQMQLECVVPSRITFITTLAICDDSEAVSQGKRIHALIGGCCAKADVVIGNALIHMYAKCTRLEDSRSIFEKMPYQDVISWNAIIAAYVQHRQRREAFQLFNRMLLEGVMPDRVSFATMLSVYVSQSSLAEGKQMHARLLASGFESDEFLMKSLVTMYGKGGSLVAAARVFGELDERDVILWTAMISAFAQHGHGRMAIRLYQQMRLEGVIPNKVTIVSILDACASQARLTDGKRIHSCVLTCNFESQIAVRNALINMYNKCGILNEAWNLFGKTSDRDIVTWTAMIAGHAHYGMGKEADQLFQEMVKQVIPNRITFINILDACSHAGLVNEGPFLFSSMSEKHGIKPTLEHYSCIIDLLGEVGCTKEAENLVYKMPFQPDVQMWRTVLGACKLHGDVERGKRAMKNVINLDPQNSSGYILLSDIYAADENWDDVLRVRETMGKQGDKVAWVQSG